MKRYLILFAFLAPISLTSQTVVFWLEDFGFGCNGGQLANNFFGINTGTWTTTTTGFNEVGASEWFVSAEENGNDAGECGSACGNDPSLHIGINNSLLPPDLGASYYEGIEGLCDIFDCGTTDKRVESPTINCSGMGNMVLDFVYMEGGNVLDNATLWYYNGASWAQLADLSKTALTCSPQGIWTAYSIALPASANNNTNVKIGFRWTNNDDGVATDPSVAIDDISLTGDFAVDLVPPTVICPPDVVVFTDENCATMLDYTTEAIIFDDVDPFPVIVQDPPIGTEITPGSYIVTITATDNSGNAADCFFVVDVIDDDAPELVCPADIVVQVPAGQTQSFVAAPIADVTENCGSYILTNDINGTDDASSIYPVGSTVVTYIVEDDSGNSNTCSFTVTVVENNQDCCLGDYNCDGFISVADLLYIVGEFGCVAGCITDLDGNGVITVVDMQIFSGLYGTVCP